MVCFAMPLPSPLGRLFQESFAAFVVRVSSGRPLNSLTAIPLVANMLNKLSGQPESYEKKYKPPILFCYPTFTDLSRW
jgi:calcium/calmodulin-dependent protein kinase I